MPSAIMFDEPGPTSVLQWRAVDALQPAADEVVIKVAAAGVNNADLLLRRGTYPVPAGAPAVLGLECSGTITAVGTGVLLTVGFVGIVRLAEMLRLGSPASRIIAAAVFVLSPRVLTTLGSISSETLPMMLAPWVLIPVVRALDTRAENAAPLWREAARASAAVALMGAVNAVATLAALGVDPSRITVVSYGKERPDATGSDESSWARNRRAVTVTVQ